MATFSQKTAVALAFIASALSLIAAAIVYRKTGEVNVTPVAGGIFMLALAVTGLRRLRNRRR